MRILRFAVCLLLTASLWLGTTPSIAIAWSLGDGSEGSSVHDAYPWYGFQNTRVGGGLSMGGYRGYSYGRTMGQTYSRAPVSRSFNYHAKNYGSALKQSEAASRNILRKNLGLTNKSLEAHHIVPWELRKHPVIERAARGGFNFNGFRNGTPVTKSFHKRLHVKKYNEQVMQTLNGILDAAPNLQDWQYASILHNLNREQSLHLAQANGVFDRLYGS